MREEHVTVGEARLWTVTTGSGPPLVLCHGGPGLWDDFGDLAELIDDVATVRRYDQRGCGRSTGGGPFTTRAFAADLDALRTHWGHERWVVAGHSWGAALATAYAAWYPERVRGLVLLAGTGIDQGWQDGYRAERGRRLSDGQRARLEQLRERQGGWTRTEHDEFCALSWSPDFAEREHAVELARRALRPDSLVNFDVNAALNADWRQVAADEAFREAVATIACPALVVTGTEDPRPPWPSRSLAAMLAGPVTYSSISGAGHLPWVEQPRAVRRALRAFLAGLTASL